MNGRVGIMRSGYLQNPDRRGNEIRVELQGIGVVSAWVDRHQRETCYGDPIWVWNRQIVHGGDGNPLVHKAAIEVESDKEAR